MFRVLVAEDSAVTRAYLVALLDGDPALQVVATARDGQEAVETTVRLRPDVVVMDVHMPRLDGLEATRRIMELAPTPIVVVSASWIPGEAALTFEALRAGALAALDKPPAPDHPDQPERVARLRETVRLMAEVKVVRRWPRREQAAVSAVTEPASHVNVVAMAASTGGPPVVAAILESLPADLGAPVLLVQHIAPGFTEGLVTWLATTTPLTVKLAAEDEALRPGTVYVAPEGFQMGVTARGRVHLADEAAGNGFRPSASYLFRSVRDSYGNAALAILLTGMGRDGAEALLALKEAGAVTVAQDEESSVVFGMPGEAVRLGAARHVLSPDRIADLIRSLSAGTRG